MREQGTELELEPGAVLFKEGDTDYHFFVVLEGEVRVTKKVGDEEHSSRSTSRGSSPARSRC